MKYQCGKRTTVVVLLIITTIIAKTSRILVGAIVGNKKMYCTPSNTTCWPTPKDIEKLYSALNPKEKRYLIWKGKPEPIPSSIPMFSPLNQPLYSVGSYGTGLKPLYIRPKNFQGKCFTLQATEKREFCLVGVRNNPLKDLNPGYIVFPTNSTQIATAVRFAKQHNLCIMVAGTGHDFLNRHSCNDGIFIRTTLMQQGSSSASLQPVYDEKAQTITFASGTTCSEAQSFASSKNVAVSCGWANTVGIVGWSIGGGHGPVAPSLGLGVDNIVNVELIDASGDTIQVNGTNEYKDLFYALRGGGGSTWGIISKLTVKAHPVPTNGYVAASSIYYADNMCEKDGLKKLSAIISGYIDFSKKLDKRYSGLVLLTPKKVPRGKNNIQNMDDFSMTATTASCGGNWTFVVLYVFSGNVSECNSTFHEFSTNVIMKNNISIYKQSLRPFEHLYDYYEEQAVSTNWIMPYPALPGVANKTPGGVPSIMVSHEHAENGNLAKQLYDRLLDCVKIGACNRQEIYHDITGQVGSPRDDHVSISKGFRNALYHLVFGEVWDDAHVQTYYDIGENSYFSESAYLQDVNGSNSWHNRYWGRENYKRLLQIKNKYDPDGLFWCRHCVGDND